MTYNRDGFSSINNELNIPKITNLEDSNREYKDFVKESIDYLRDNYDIVQKYEVRKNFLIDNGYLIIEDEQLKIYEEI